MKTLVITFSLAVAVVAVVTVLGFVVVMSKLRACQLKELESGN